MASFKLKFNYGCKFPNCDNKSYNLPNNKRFFKFPTNDVILNKWQEVCNLNDVNCKNFKICEDHFNSTDFIPPLNFKLKPDSVPKLAFYGFEVDRISKSCIRDDAQKDEIVECSELSNDSVFVEDNSRDNCKVGVGFLEDRDDISVGLDSVDIPNNIEGEVDCSNFSSLSENDEEDSVFLRKLSTSKRNLTPREEKVYAIYRSTTSKNQMDSPINLSDDEEGGKTTINASNSKDVKSEIEAIESEIKLLTRKRDSLTSQISRLKEKHKSLSESYNLKKGLFVDDSYSKTNFTWSTKVQEILENVFKLKSFRSKQLTAINLTLSKEDVILLMPTGGGKTLCYQLPAIMNSGMTLVISPLLALIEDQLIKLRELNINAMAMSSGTSKESKLKGFHYMTKGVGEPIKVMYVTPEWLSKSKKFMSSLQKLHEAKKLNQIAIDEVHCCSQWGHDFRPDYKFLGLLKGMFPDVPILGVTATATTAVLLDIQDMLDIQGCKIVRDRFDRPNLHYKVVPKQDKLEDNAEYLMRLLKTKFENKVGIIYTTTIKDCETLTKVLREKGLSVQPYHADLADEVKTKIHRKWIDNKLQAVIATVAFGMGIDKLNVHFVIHYAVPKSMETLYQEAGRAGRDGKYAQCIVMYKLGDYLKNSGYARSKTEVKNALSVLEYCLNLETCRHQLIGVHFEDTEIPPCKETCDNCFSSKKLKKYDAKSACEDIYKIIDHGLASDTNLTLSKLVDLWLNPKIKIKKPSISRRQAENIIGNLLIKKCIREEKSYTAYSVNCYLRKNSLSETIVITLKDENEFNNYLQSYNKKRKVKDEHDSVLNKKINSTISID